MADWWLTAEGSRTINLAGEFLKRGIGFMRGVEDLLQRIATGIEKDLESRQAQPWPDMVQEPRLDQGQGKNWVVLSLGTSQLHVPGRWASSAPGSWLFLTSGSELCFEGKQIQIGGAQVKIVDGTQEEVGDEVAGEDFGRICDLVGAEGHLVMINIGPGIDVVPYIMPSTEP